MSAAKMTRVQQVSTRPYEVWTYVPSGSEVSVEMVKGPEFERVGPVDRPLKHMSRKVCVGAFLPYEVLNRFDKYDFYSIIDSDYDSNDPTVQTSYGVQDLFNETTSPLYTLARFRSFRNPFPKITSFHTPAALLGFSMPGMRVYESDDSINQQMKEIYEKDGRPFLAIGQATESYFEGNEGVIVLKDQLMGRLQSISAEVFMKGQTAIVFAPEYALSGMKIDSITANAVHAHIRSAIAELYSQEVADRTTIMCDANALNMMDAAVNLCGQEHIDGLLCPGIVFKRHDGKDMYDFVPFHPRAGLFQGEIDVVEPTYLWLTFGRDSGLQRAYIALSEKPAKELPSGQAALGGGSSLENQDVEVVRYYAEAGEDSAQELSGGQAVLGDGSPQTDVSE